MTDVSGVLRVGEAAPAVKDIAARLRGANMVYVIVLLALAMAGAVAGRLVAPSNDISGLVGAGAGAALYLPFAKRLAIWRYRRKFTERGFSNELTLLLEIRDDTLCYVVGDITESAPWRAVSELFQSHDYWIFLVQGSSWFAPRRFFADVNTERVFVRAALERMSDAAKERSTQAVTFAEQD
jgi:hypothetical protein